jgi:hypothetical protein
MSKYEEYAPGSLSDVLDTSLIIMENLAGGATKKFTKAQLVTLFGGTPAPDTIPPVLQSIAVNNADPTKIVLTYNESLDTASVPLASAYGVAGKTVSGVSIVGPSVFLTVSVAYVTGAAVTVTYTPGTGPVRDLAHNNAVGFINFPGVNNVGTTTGGGANLIIGNF